MMTWIVDREKYPINIGDTRDTTYACTGSSARIFCVTLIYVFFCEFGRTTVKDGNGKPIAGTPGKQIITAAQHRKI